MSTQTLTRDIASRVVDPKPWRMEELLEPAVLAADGTSLRIEFLGRLASWLSEPRTPNALLLRELIMFRVLWPALIDSMTLEDIGKACNCSRQHAQQTEVDFVLTFGVHSAFEKKCPTRSPQQSTRSSQRA